jgi:hypothetical protein
MMLLSDISDRAAGTLAAFGSTARRSALPLRALGPPVYAAQYLFYLNATI